MKRHWEDSNWGRRGMPGEGGEGDDVPWRRERGERVRWEEDNTVAGSPLRRDVSSEAVEVLSSQFFTGNCREAPQPRPSSAYHRYSSAAGVPLATQHTSCPPLEHLGCSVASVPGPVGAAAYDAPPGSVTAEAFEAFRQYQERKRRRSEEEAKFLRDRE